MLFKFGCQFVKIFTYLKNKNLNYT